MSSSVPSLVSFDPSGHSFTTGANGRASIALGKRRPQPHDEDSNATSSGQQQDAPRRKERVRISLKGRQPVHMHASTLTAEPTAHDDEETAGGVDLSLAAATGQRRRIIEVRSKSSREAQQNARRDASAALPSQASGFNTRGGSRRACIVLPQNAEKMAAREQLMQMHPHIAQVFRGLNPPDVFTQEAFSRVLAAEAPTLPYRRRNLEAKTTVQWGERKLFLYELEFLTQYGAREGTVVVYAGVAPATRIPFLASLLPHISFLLVDPTPLDFDESAHANIQVRQESFSDDLARELQAQAAAESKPMLFVANATSDTPNGYVAGAAEEDYVDQHAFSSTSMADQSRWHTLLQPHKSLLKFSLPWTNASTHYHDGDILLPVWNPPTSTETRLVPNEFNRTWSHRHYEEQMFYFNTATRVSLHEHGVEAEGLDGCGDCSAEVFILERYLERYPAMVPVAVGSQSGVVPAASAPAVSLRLDTTKFSDPAWLAAQKAKRQFRITIDNSDGQPPTDDATAENEEMVEGKEVETEAPAAAAAAASELPPSSSAGLADSAMSDAAPAAAVALTPIAQLKLNVGQFSQELSRRLTNNGTRTLATLNERVIKKAAFSRKNRG